MGWPAVYLWILLFACLAPFALLLRRRAPSTSRRTFAGHDVRDFAPTGWAAPREARKLRFDAARSCPFPALTTGRARRSLTNDASKNDLSSQELDELIELCEHSPKEGLARIDRLDAQTRRQPLVMFARVVAFRRLIYGPEGEFERRFGNDFELFLRTIDGEKRGYARDGLKQVAEIERLVPTFFVDDDWREAVADLICLVAERTEPATVQTTLGWTKLYFFGPDRVLTLRDASPFIEQLRDVPDDVLGDLMMIRFSLPQRIRSAVAIAARRTPRDGWLVLFALFERADLPKTGKLGSLVVGFLTLAQSGGWRFDRPGEMASVSEAMDLKFEEQSTNRLATEGHDRWHSLLAGQQDAPSGAARNYASGRARAPRVLGLTPARVLARTGDRLVSRAANGISIDRVRAILARENCSVEEVKLSDDGELVFVDFVFLEDAGRAQITLSDPAPNNTYGRCAFKAFFESNLTLSEMNDLNRRSKFLRFFAMDRTRLVIEFDVLTLDLPDIAIATNLDLFHGSVRSIAGHGFSYATATSVAQIFDRRRS